MIQAGDGDRDAPSPAAEMQLPELLPDPSPTPAKARGNGIRSSKPHGGPWKNTQHEILCITNCMYCYFTCSIKYYLQKTWAFK